MPRSLSEAPARHEQRACLCPRCRIFFRPHRHHCPAHRRCIEIPVKFSGFGAKLSLPAPLNLDGRENLVYNIYWLICHGLRQSVILIQSRRTLRPHDPPPSETAFDPAGVFLLCSWPYPMNSRVRVRFCARMFIFITVMPALSMGIGKAVFCQCILSAMPVPSRTYCLNT